MDKEKKSILIKTVIVFIITFFIVNGGIHFQFFNQKKEAMLKANYTAEATVRRIESQIDKYLSKSDLLKKIIEAYGTISDEHFYNLAWYLKDDNNVIEAIEVAKDGVLDKVYPYEGNEKAVGLNFFENSERKEEAMLAKESGQYTIAGPFELVQGGTGALLFDPVYIKNNGEDEFWGFVVFVIDWDKFVKEIELDKMEDADYHYQIWKYDMTSGKAVTLAECDEFDNKNALKVTCEVPNDNWYFNIVPHNGWISRPELIIGSIIGVLLSLLAALAYWQFAIRRYKDKIYAENIEKTALEAKQANEAKTRFLFNMSHDIRTPMNAIIGFSNLLESNIDNREKLVDYIAKIRYSGYFLLSIINHVLEMARIESGKLILEKNVVCIKEIVAALDAVFEPEVGKKNITSKYSINVKHDYAICDETKVKEIFLNIVSNSVKYTPENGKITVNIDEIGELKDGVAKYQITIEDNGIGMSKEYLPHIFEEFTREHTSTETKVTGTGLGLPIVKSLVDMMNGTINIESEEGKGTKTTITLNLPVATDEQILESHKKRKDIIVDRLKEKIILLAEDNDLNAEIAITILENNGFKTERAKNGSECIKMLEDKPDDYYACVLMDIQMPVMNGYEATKKIRSLNDNKALTPIIAMTANAFEEDRIKAKKAGMNDHIVKPIDVNKMLNVIGKYI